MGRPRDWWLGCRLDRDLDQPVNDVAELLGRVEFVCARSAKERLDLRDMPKDELAFLAALAVAVGGSTRERAEEDSGGRAEQDDRVEPWVEPALVHTVPETYRAGSVSVARSSLIRSSFHM